jgi:hypothetical protein
MLDKGRDILRVRSVHHIEEELSVWEVGERALLGEELGELRLSHDIFNKAHDTQLVVLRYFNRPQLCPWYEMLSAGKDLLKEVLGYLLDGGHIVLAWDIIY